LLPDQFLIRSTFDRNHNLTDRVKIFRHFRKCEVVAKNDEITGFLPGISQRLIIS